MSFIFYMVQNAPIIYVNTIPPYKRQNFAKWVFIPFIYHINLYEVVKYVRKCGMEGDIFFFSNSLMVEFTHFN